MSYGRHCPFTHDASSADRGPAQHTARTQNTFPIFNDRTVETWVGGTEPVNPIDKSVCGESIATYNCRGTKGRTERALRGG